MPKIILMKGLPASGKSTRAKEIMKESGNTVRLNKDLLRTMLHFDKFTGANEYLTNQAQMAMAIELLNTGVNVIIDDTNLNPKVVEKWRQLALDKFHKFEIVEMDTPVDECVERDQRRWELGERHVGPIVIKNMARQYRIKYTGKRDILVDLDGTLAEISHRLHFVEQNPKDWKGFFGAISQDTVRRDVVDKVCQWSDTHNIVIISTRPETYLHETIRWLEANHLDLLPIDTIIMRRAGDSRENSEVKKEILEKYFDKSEIDMVFDDRPRVIRMWCAQGLQVEDVGKGIEF